MAKTEKENESERARQREIPREENPKRLENRILTAFGHEKTHDVTPGKAGSLGKGITNSEDVQCWPLLDFKDKNPLNRQANRSHLGSHDPTAVFGVGAQRS